MKVLLDTNIILDDALEREPFLDASEQVLVLVEQRQVESYISASTFSCYAVSLPLKRYSVQW
ncbi:PIN domain-containing protein [Nostoc sp. CHAB 5784]|uniref:PIN domain-containing protein n=1 Tax=Nostoc mirabile TaxID=2907820 RepID=UPI001E4B0935|nr:PIN domain-containing protein [Nostoc mirabile]MCC5664466.1 PIN domain-containing protein [Nostoc mirabile CHAB5784]